MISKKELIKQIEEKKRKILNLQYDLDIATNRILGVMKENDLQKQEIEKYKRLYLQMLEANLILADKVGVNNE